jgi:hypothetical protein
VVYDVLDRLVAGTTIVANDVEKHALATMHSLVLRHKTFEVCELSQQILILKLQRPRLRCYTRASL